MTELIFCVPHQEQHGCDKGGNRDNEEESQQQKETAMRAKGARGWGERQQAANDEMRRRE